jgi:type 1 fimbria pilin
MTRSWLRGISALMLVLAASIPAFAQASGGTTTLSGTVVDAAAGVVPGATVDVKNNATRSTSSTR